MAEVDSHLRADWQRPGSVSFVCCTTLWRSAGAKGVKGFCAYVLAANRKMLQCSIRWVM